MTCKEPLRVSTASHLRSLFGITNEHMLPLVEHAISVLCSDNLDLACAIIEKAATDRAIREIDDALTQSYALRRKYRERPSGSPFLDMSHLAARFASAIPDLLRPKTGIVSFLVPFFRRLTKLFPLLGGLQPHQLRVYEDFLLAPSASTAPSSPSPLPKTSPQPSTPPGTDTPIPDGADRTALGRSSIQIVPGVTHTGPVQYLYNSGTVNQSQSQDAGTRRGSASAPPGLPPAPLPSDILGEPMPKVPSLSPPPSIVDRLSAILSELEKAASRVPPSSYAHLPPEHEVPQMIALLSAHVSQLGAGPTPAKLDAVAYLAQRILARLFDKATSMC